MKKYPLKEFIEQVVIPDLRKMINHQLHYYAFSVICQAIEVMGSIYDQKNLEDYGASETRFNNAIDNLFRDKRYREKRKIFYSFLRGPLIHQLRPGEGVFISSEKKDNILRANHLNNDIKSGALILVIEQFFSDFIDAYNIMKAELAKRTDLDNRKIEQDYIAVMAINPPHPMTEWDGDSNTLSTLTSYITGSAGIQG